MADPETQGLQNAMLESGTLDNETEITLGLLNAVHENSALTQRSIARDLGIALGLANAYLKRCVKKGLIKVSQVPANRYAYYLTPKGFSEKSRLTAEYLSSSFGFFRAARGQCTDAFMRCAENGWLRVGLAGTGDLGEIATLCALETPVVLAGFIEAGVRGSDKFAGLPIVGSLAELGAIDAVLVTDLRAPQETYERMAAVFPFERLFVPRLLHVSRNGANIVVE
ncbi:MAG: winged helix-turn-helix transcriptional regulator [Alphaproteobacteria bacterium]